MLMIEVMREMKSRKISGCDVVSYSGVLNKISISGIGHIFHCIGIALSFS